MHSPYPELKSHYRSKITENIEVPLHERKWPQINGCSTNNMLEGVQRHVAVSGGQESEA